MVISKRKGVKIIVENQNYLGDIIKSIRKYKTMTQSDLSKTTGFSQNTISNHENKKRNIGVNEVTTYSKGLDVPSYLIFKINEEMKNTGQSDTLKNFPAFYKIYQLANKAYLNEGDIYFYSYDIFDEALEIYNILKKKGMDVYNIDYDYFLDLYKQLLSKENNVLSKKEDKNSVSINEIIEIGSEYLDLLSCESNIKSDKDIENAIEKSRIIESKSLIIANKLKQAPNYFYDAIKGEPMYTVYEFKYPQRLKEFRERIINLKQGD